MKRRYLISVSLSGIFLLSLFVSPLVHADVFRFMRVGKYHVRVFDSTCQRQGTTYGLYYDDTFRYKHAYSSGWDIGTTDWTDANGTYWPYKLSGTGVTTVNEDENTIPIPDEEGITIRRYWRFEPPTIIVDGFNIEDLYPQPGDEVNPSKIPGTADCMTETTIRTSMGVTVRQRTFHWGQTNHDDYIIFDWTMYNTGNIDLDDEIELPNQTLENVYLMKSSRFRCGSGSKHWNTAYGERPGDSLRACIKYSERQRTASYDQFGDPRSNGWLRQSNWLGNATLWIDKSTSDHTDDPSQPQMTGYDDSEVFFTRVDAHMLAAPDLEKKYKIMRDGWGWLNGAPYMEDAYPGTHHSVRMDELGYKFPRDIPFFNYEMVDFWSYGPYTLAPGDSLRVVDATVLGGISPEKNMEVGKAWLNGTAVPPPGFVYGETADERVDNLPPQFKAYPDLAPTFNDWAKDCWVATGKDSLFMNISAAQWAVRNNYNVPIPPPPPSIEVKSLPDKINITWNDDSEAAADFAGYRVYRSNYPDTAYAPIFECGEGTANPLTHSYDDTDAQRGFAYFYSVVAFDDGIQNIPDFNGKKQSLESGIYLNRTTQGAHLTRPAGTLATVRVVPNPYNINAQDLQYTSEPDKIMFLDLPFECTIKIYTESGDLIKTIDHSGSGDEPWGVLAEQQSATDSGQIV
ncbi:hypothetical protein ACFL4K_02890, partial [Candidatus Neomarinimicrobiota bacterium]